ncbi:MAG: hypothetical protein Q8M01_06000 [Rubrivivax sp.]|nr:hypothetical protein [Rubrivivax sp.]
MRYLLLALPLLLGQVPAAQAQVTVGIGIELPGVRIGINLPVLPDLVRVPGYPVYYAPQAQANYFFYDGLYWVFQGDNWYASSWYNGPWRRIGPDHVPVYVLRVPVRYYRQPPAYFRSWRADAPPRWGEHWGSDWQQRRPGWDRWDRRAAPPPAPLPTYQRKYPQSRYPQEPERQHSIRSENYRYQPRDPQVRQHYQMPDRAPTRESRPAVPQRRVAPEQRVAPRPPAPPPQAEHRARPQPAPTPREQRPQAAPQDRSRDPGRAEPSNRGQDRKDDARERRRDDRKDDRGSDRRGGG